MISMAHHVMMLQKERQGWQMAQFQTSQELQRLSKEAESWEEMYTRAKNDLRDKNSEIKRLKSELSRSQEKCAQLEKAAKARPPPTKRQPLVRVPKKKATPKPPPPKKAKKPTKVAKPVIKPKNKHQQSWDEKFERLKAFKEANGHFKCDAVKVWMADQRTQHRKLREGKHSTLSADRVRRLVAIGFKFSVVKDPPLKWEVRFDQLVQYKAEHGHSNVPQKWPNVKGLGEFVVRVRQRYREQQEGLKTIDNSLTPERIAKMNSIGFQWKLRTRTRTSKPNITSNGGGRLSFTGEPTEAGNLLCEPLGFIE